MPGFDRTGPWGTGPMTGGRRGLCASRSTGGNQFGGGCRFGRGMGFNRGRGFGPGRGLGRDAWVQDYYGMPDSPGSSMSREQEIDFLQSHARSLKEDIDDLQARLSQLEAKGA